MLSTPSSSFADIKVSVDEPFSLAEPFFEVFESDFDFPEPDFSLEKDSPEEFFFGGYETFFGQVRADWMAKTRFARGS